MTIQQLTEREHATGQAPQKTSDPDRRKGPHPRTQHPTSSRPAQGESKETTQLAKQEHTTAQAPQTTTPSAPPADPDRRKAPHPTMQHPTNHRPRGPRAPAPNPPAAATPSTRQATRIKGETRPPRQQHSRQRNYSPRPYRINTG